MEKVSVIVPVFNAEAYLRECLDSIINQTYTNLEIILVNDGSTDRSAAICEEYATRDNRVRVYHKKLGGNGVGATRNTALSLVTGDYILFVDNDDWLEHTHIELLYEALQKYNADIVASEVIRATNIDNYNEKKKFDKLITEYTRDEYLEIYFKIKGNKTIYYAPSKLYKREVLEETGIPYKVDRLAFIHENFFKGKGVIFHKNMKCHEVAFYYLMKPKGNKELNSNSYSNGVKENMYWIPIDELDQYKAYPTFFKEKLKNLKNEIEHIVTVEE